MAEPDRHYAPYWPAAMRAERAAAYLDVSATYFRSSIACGLTPIRPSPGVVLYLRRDLDGWLDRQVGGPAASAALNPWHQAPP